METGPLAAPCRLPAPSAALLPSPTGLPSLTLCPLLSRPPACISFERIQMPSSHFFIENPVSGSFSVSFPRVNCHRNDNFPSC